MKKFLFIVALVCTAATIDSCSSSSSSTTTSPSAVSSTYPYMIGKIEIIGNEPFTKIALRVDESHLFMLKAPKELEQKLVQHQQGLVRLYYSSRQEKAKEHILNVDHIEKIDVTK